MPGRGPAPKDPSQRARTNVDTIQQTTLVDDGELRGPAFEDAELLYDVEVVNHVRRWWDTWRAAPQAAAFMATDWERLRFLAPLVSAYFVEPRQTLLSEIRLNEERLGATVVDRQRARMRVDESAPSSTPRPATRLGKSAKWADLRVVDSGS